MVGNVDSQEHAEDARGHDEVEDFPRRKSSARWSSAHVHVSDKPSKRMMRAFRRKKAKEGQPWEQEDLKVVLGERGNEHFPQNRFVTSRYTVWNFAILNLSEQFRRVANSYFILITIMQLFPGVTPVPLFVTVAPLSIIFGVTAVKEAYEDYQRHKADRKVNTAPVRVLRGEDGGEEVVPSQNVRVGEVIAVERDAVCAADIVILATEHLGKHSGGRTCWVDTANLDGESRFKVRRALDLSSFIPRLAKEAAQNSEATSQPTTQELSTLDATLVTGPPNPWLEVFVGRMDASDDDAHVGLLRENLMLRGSILRNTKCVWGVVVGAGPMTKLRLNQQTRSSKFSRLERALNVALAAVWTFQTVLCIIIATASALSPEVMSVLSVNPEELTWAAFPWDGEDEANMLVMWIYSFMTLFILFSFMVPMAMYVILELGKLFGGLFIYWDLEMRSRDGRNRPAIANTTSLVEELGEIQYILSDKTGTLTDNVMRFTHCATVDGKQYEMNYEDAGVPKLNLIGSVRKPVLPGTFVGEAKLKDLFLAMAACNEVEVEDESEDDDLTSQKEEQVEDNEDEDQGSEDDLVAEKVPNLEYSGESPDEIAMCSVARDLGVILEERKPDQLRVRFAHSNTVQTYEILAVLPFNSSRKRMGIVLAEKNSFTALVLYKGADNIMQEIMRSQVLAPDIERLSILGMRTLVMGMARISLTSPAFRSFKADYNKADLDMSNRDVNVGKAFSTHLEGLLEPVGCTGVEDKLSDGVEDALKSFVAAKVQIAVLTGDKTETAISICRSCGLFKPFTEICIADVADEAWLSDFFARQEGLTRTETSASVGSSAASEGGDALNAERPGTALVISGESLRVCMEDPVLLQKLVSMMRKCYTTICTRVTPKQKALVTKLVRDEFGVVCLAIGDGANDVSMIREADVGVGIFGKEGSQAVNSSDFAIHRFADLRRLLFVHGANSRLRTTNAAKGGLFTNMAFNTPQILYTFANVFSGQSIENTSVLSIINLAMTGPFIVTLSILEQEMKPHIQEKNPVLYDPFSKTLSFNEYLVEMGFAFWQGSVAYLWFVFLDDVWVDEGLAAGLQAEATLLTLLCVMSIMVNLTMRFTLFTWLHIFAASLGMGMLWFAAVGTAELAPASTENGAFLSSYANLSPVFWLSLPVGIAISVLPYWVVKVYMNWWHPRPVDVFREAMYRKSRVHNGAENIDTVSV